MKIADFCRFLTAQGWQYAGIKGGLEKWVKAGALRPVIFQTHIDPIPLPVIRNELRTMGVTTQDLILFLQK